MPQQNNVKEQANQTIMEMVRSIIYAQRLSHVDISPKLDKEDLDANGNVLEQDQKHDMEEDSKADILAAKSTRSGEASKFDHGKKTATKPPSPPQDGNETLGISRYRDRPHKLLGE